MVDAAALNAIYVLLNHGRPDERLLAQSDAVIYVLRSLTKTWRTAGSLFRIMPKPLRNKAYGLVAHHRYRLFGKYDVCPIPSAEYRKKFIDL
jgi:predicted DCC family thiol-disulfide oxidoreductase YuxK